MIELTNTTPATVEPGAAVPFNNVIWKCGCGECWNRQLPNSIKLRSGGLYALSFSGDITSPTAGQAVQLAIAVGGQPLVETAMTSTPSAANAFNHVSTQTRFAVTCADLDRVTVINTGTTPVVVAQNSNLIVERRS